MYSLVKICCVCLEYTGKLKPIDVIDFDNIKIERKLTYCITTHKHIRPAIPLYICSKCRKTLRIAYEFKKAYYKSCTKLKDYVAQLKRNKNCYKNAGRNNQRELQVQIMNLGECMVDGKFSHDLVKIENVETQFVMSESANSETNNILTSSQDTELTDDSIVRQTKIITDANENILTNGNNSNTESDNLTEENMSSVFNSEDYLDIEEDVKNFATECEEEIVDNKEDIDICEDKEDVCKIWVEHKNVYAVTNFVEEDIKNFAECEDEIVDNKEGIDICEDKEEVCKIWVENKNVYTVTNFVEEDIKNFAECEEEIVDNKEDIDICEDKEDVCKIWVENKTNEFDNTISDVKSEKSHKKRKDSCYQSSKKKMKHSNITTYSSSDSNDHICHQCQRQFTYAIGYLNYLFVHSCNKAFCSPFCRQQYDKMCSK